MSIQVNRLEPFQIPVFFLIFNFLAYFSPLYYSELSQNFWLHNKYVLFNILNHRTLLIV